MSKSRALIIDDNRMMRNMIGKMLDPDKFEIIEASNGKEGIDILLQDDSIKLILCDINMPVMDGFAFLESKKSIESHLSTDVIMITSLRTDEVIKQVTESGAAGWLSKPFKKEKLDEILSLVMS